MALIFAGCGNKAGDTTRGNSCSTTTNETTDAGNGTSTTGDNTCGQSGETTTNVATVYCWQNGNNMQTVTFNTNGTWEWYVCGSFGGVSVDLIMMTGTYTGNPKVNGNISVVGTQAALGLIRDNYSSTVSNATGTLTNEEAPLEPVSDESASETLIISNGTLNWMGDVTLTRQ